MLIGQTIAANDSAKKYRTPWMPRQGSDVVSNLEILGISTDVLITFRLFHKNSDDTGDGAANGSTTATGAGVHHFESNDVRQLVRYEIQIESNTLPAPDWNWSHLRVLPPIWSSDGAQDI